MAAIACTRRLADRIVRAVASRARCARMLPKQRKAGVAAVVERRRFPICRRVTAGAIGAARSAVDIILCVATDTGLRQSLPFLTGMTCHAF